MAKVTNLVAKMAAAGVVMAKQLHIVYNNMESPAVRRLFNPVTDGRFHAEKHFMKHENSQVLDWYGERYVQFTGNAFGKQNLEHVQDTLLGWAKKASGVGLRTGVVTEKNPEGLESWKFLYGSWSDKGSMIMIPKNSKKNSLDDFGLHVINPDKAGKYIKRHFAPHEYMVFGEILDYKEITEGMYPGDYTTFKLENGYVGVWRNIPLDTLNARELAAVDGHNRMSGKFATEGVGVSDRNINTYAAKADCTGLGGLGKGFFHVDKNMDEIDIVTYGAKKAVVTDYFSFGILGALKPGNSYKSDIQSMANFDLFLFAPERAENFFNNVTDALNDADRMRGMFISRARNLSKVVEFTDDVPAFDREPDELQASTQKWMLINALEAGMDIVGVEPSIWRRVYGHFMTEVMNAEKGRIPFDEDGIRADITPDPHMFDAYGNIHLENSIISAGFHCCMDIPQGPTMSYRQPNGMAMEHAQAVNKHFRQFEAFTGRHRTFYGPDLLEVLEPLNGADLDDTVCILHDPKIVKHTRELNYPVTSKITVEEQAKHAIGRFYNRMTRIVENISTASYTVSDFASAMQRVREMTVRLGQVVNQISLDTLLSGPHKANMKEYLTHLIQITEDRGVKEFILDKREWLANRPDYQLADVATNLEAVIDYCIQGRGTAKQFKPFMDKVFDIMQNTEVYPEIFAKPGTGFQGMGKLPATRLLGVNCLLAPSLLDKALNEIERMRGEFLNDMRMREWESITSVPEELEYEFPYNRDISNIARDIMKEFNPRIVAAMTDSLDPKVKRGAYNEVLYGRFDETKKNVIQDGLQQVMEAFDPDMQMHVAVEIKRIVHRDRTPKFYEDGPMMGQVKSVRDGIFGNNVIFGYYLAALDKCGLTGKYVFVELDQTSITKRIADQIFPVVVTDTGNVLRKSDEFWIGTVDAEAGEYRLVNGMLELRKPHVSITAEANNYVGGENDEITDDVK